MLALVRTGLPRQAAYEMVQESALASRAGEGAFRELLAGPPTPRWRLGSARRSCAPASTSAITCALGAIISRASAR